MSTIIGNTKLYCREPERWRNTLTSVGLVRTPCPEITEVPNGVMLPMRWIAGSNKQFVDGLLEGGVIDSTGKFIAGLERSLGNKPVNRTCASGYSYNSTDLVKRDEDVVYGGVLAGAWGHMLVDATSRLWYAREAQKRKLKVVFLIIPSQKLAYPALLHLAGLPEGSYELIDRPTQFRSITVPASSVFLKSGNYTEHWLQIFNTMRENALSEASENIDRPSKIYLSRAQYKYQNIVGENYFEQFFVNQDYEPVSLEQLPLAEQIATLASAKSIATTMGTLAHMALFCNDETEIIILNRSRTVVDTQAVINDARKLHCTLVDVFASFLPDRQTTGCPVLLAPGIEWETFARDRFGIEPDMNYRQYQFPSNAVEYAGKWGEFYAGEWGFDKIRNTSIREVVALTNDVFNGKSIDPSTLPEPVELIRLRSEVARLRLRIEELENALADNSSMPTYTSTQSCYFKVEAVSWKDGVLALGGTTELAEDSFHSMKSMNASIVLVAKGSDEYVCDLDLDSSSPFCITWSAAVLKHDIACALRRLYARTSFDSVRLAIVIDFDDASNRELIPLGLDYSESALRSYRGQNLRFGAHIARARWYRGDVMRLDVIKPQEIASAIKKRLP